MVGQRHPSQNGAYIDDFAIAILNHLRHDGFGCHERCREIEPNDEFKPVRIGLGECLACDQTANNVDEDEYGDGGGIYSLGDVELIDSAVTGNSATNAGSQSPMGMLVVMAITASWEAAIDRAINHGSEIADAIRKAFL